MDNKFVRSINFSNKAKRIPICFCIDTSYSMNLIVEGTPKGKGKEVYRDQKVYIEYGPEDTVGCKVLMDRVYDGMKTFYNAIYDDDMACDSCEAAIVTFSDNTHVYETFTPVDRDKTLDFSEYMGENTNVSPAIRTALNMLAEQKELYKKNKIAYFQPWIVLFTDGLPTDDVSAVKRELMSMQEDGKLSVYTMALSEDPELLEALKGFSKKPPIQCTKKEDIQRYFDFLAKSASVVASGGTPADFF